MTHVTLKGDVGHKKVNDNFKIYGRINLVNAKLSTKKLANTFENSTKSFTTTKQLKLNTNMEANSSLNN